MASDAGNFWEYIGRFRTFPYFHSIIFVVNYKMNIISSHKMYIISPSVTRAAIRGWFRVSGCSSDISRCISDTDTGIQVTACEAPPHPRPYCRGRVWRSFDTGLGSRVFEAPFVSLVESGTGTSDHDGSCTAARANQPDKQLFSLQNWIHDPTWFLRIIK